MESNNFHNLTTQLVQESKSIWRIKKLYIKESKSKDLKAFWTKMAKQKEEEIIELKKLLKAELK